MGIQRTQTLTGTTTLTTEMGRMLFLDPGGASRAVSLPPMKAGLILYVKNTTTDAEDLTFTDAETGLVTVAVLGPGDLGILYTDGVSWGAMLPTAIDAGEITTAMLATGILSADAAGRALMAAGFFTEAHATSVFAAGAITGALLKDGALSADATGRAKIASDFFDETTATAKFADASIATVLLKAANVTPPKMAFTGMKTATFAGVGAAGAITATGTVVGDRVIAVFKFGDVSDNLTAVDGAATSQPNALFESAITVNDQIQQLSGDLSDNKYIAILLPAAA